MDIFKFSVNYVDLHSAIADLGSHKFYTLAKMFYTYWGEVDKNPDAPIPHHPDKSIDHHLSYFCGKLQGAAKKIEKNKARAAKKD